VMAHSRSAHPELLAELGKRCGSAHQQADHRHSTRVAKHFDIREGVERLVVLHIKFFLNREVII